MNDYTTRGVYSISASNISNAPVNTTAGITANLTVFKAYDWCIWQLFTVAGGDVYSRVCNGLQSNTWSAWQRIDNYGTSSLSELASALGAQGQTTAIGGAVVDAIMDTYDNVSAYSTFEGTTMSESEGRWLGYKHGSTGVGIYMANTIGLCYFKIDSNRNFTIKRLCP